MVRTDNSSVLSCNSFGALSLSSMGTGIIQINLRDRGVANNVVWAPKGGLEAQRY